MQFINPPEYTFGNVGRTLFVPGADGRNSSSTFGTITSARDARIVQLGLKVLF